MNRRTFLGAAAAALALPAEADAAATDRRVDVSEPAELGSGAARTEGVSAWSDVELKGGVDEVADLSATGYWHDDEPPSVEVTVQTAHANLILSFDPEEAQRFAADLRTAATHALQGDAELTSGERDA